MVTQLSHILPLIPPELDRWHSPSIETGLFSSIDDERRLRCRGCRYIEHFVKILQAQSQQQQAQQSQSILSGSQSQAQGPNNNNNHPSLLSSAFFYMQVFYTYFPADKDDLGLVCLASTMLAFKLSDNHKKMREIFRCYSMELYSDPDQWPQQSDENEGFSQKVREQICKIESFLLRAMKFHLELPGAEGRVMLEIYVERFKKIFVDKEFQFIEDSGPDNHTTIEQVEVKINTNVESETVKNVTDASNVSIQNVNKSETGIDKTDTNKQTTEAAAATSTVVVDNLNKSQCLKTRSKSAKDSESPKSPRQVSPKRKSISPKSVAKKQESNSPEAQVIHVSDNQMNSKRRKIQSDPNSQKIQNKTHGQSQTQITVADDNNNIPIVKLSLCPKSIKLQGPGLSWEQRLPEFARPSDTSCLLQLRSKTIIRILRETLQQANGTDSEYYHDDSSGYNDNCITEDFINDVHRTAKNFLTDAFRTFIVLQFLPYKIAIGSFFLALVFRAQKDRNIFGAKLLRWAPQKNEIQNQNQNQQGNSITTKNSCVSKIEEPPQSDELYAIQNTYAYPPKDLQDHMNYPTTIASTATPASNDTATTPGESEAVSTVKLSTKPKLNTITNSDTNPRNTNPQHESVFELMCLIEPNIRKEEIKIIYEEIVAIVRLHSTIASSGEKLKKVEFSNSDINNVPEPQGTGTGKFSLKRKRGKSAEPQISGGVG